MTPGDEETGVSTTDDLVISATRDWPAVTSEQVKLYLGQSTVRTIPVTVTTAGTKITVAHPPLAHDQVYTLRMVSVPGIEDRSATFRTSINAEVQTRSYNGDVTTGLVTIVSDERGYPLSSVTASGPGPNKLWGDADDVKSALATFSMSADLLTLQQVSYARGPDNQFGTGDDVQETCVITTRTLLGLRSVVTKSAGMDHLCFTGDDRAVSSLTIDFDPQDRPFRATLFDPSDRITSTTVTTYDGLTETDIVTYPNNSVGDAYTVRTRDDKGLLVSVVARSIGDDDAARTADDTDTSGTFYTRDARGWIELESSVQPGMDGKVGTMDDNVQSRATYNVESNGNRLTKEVRAPDGRLLSVVSYNGQR